MTTDMDKIRVREIIERAKLRQNGDISASPMQRNAAEEKAPPKRVVLPDRPVSWHVVVQLDFQEGDTADDLIVALKEMASKVERCADLGLSFESYNDGFADFTTTDKAVADHYCAVVGGHFNHRIVEGFFPAWIWSRWKEE